jgi:hypothetical protein
MALDEVAAVVERFVVAAKVALTQIIAAAATLVAIKTERLLVTLLAVVARVVGQGAVIAHKISAVVGGNPFGLVAAATFTQLHAGKICVGCLLVSKAQLVQEGDSHYENCTENKKLFH